MPESSLDKVLDLLVAEGLVSDKEAPDLRRSSEGWRWSADPAPRGRNSIARDVNPAATTIGRSRGGADFFLDPRRRSRPGANFEGQWRKLAAAIRGNGSLPGSRPIGPRRDGRCLRGLGYTSEPPGSGQVPQRRRSGPYHAVPT